MTDHKLSYEDYRQRRIREAFPDDGVVDDQDCYLNREEKPETDALMAQYEEMQRGLLESKPATPEYDAHLQDMTGVMDQLAEINPTNTVRGELQRLLRLSSPRQPILDLSAHGSRPSGPTLSMLPSSLGFTASRPSFARVRSRTRG